MCGWMPSRHSREDGFERGFAADSIFRKMGGAGSPGLRPHPTDENLSVGAPDLGLSSDARYAGWMVGFNRGFAAYLIFRKTAGGLWRE